MKRKLTGTQKDFLAKFASGELNAKSQGSDGSVASCRNLIKRGLLLVDGTLTDAGQAALNSGFYTTARG